MNMNIATPGQLSSETGECLLSPVDDAQVRANQDGSPCPSWCVIDHAKHGFHASEIVSAEAPEYHFAHVRALHYGNERSIPVVSVSAAGMLDLSPGDAETLAALIDQLASATPERHRVLAHVIRQCIAVAKTA